MTIKLTCLGGPYDAGSVVENSNCPELSVTTLPLQDMSLSMIGVSEEEGVKVGWLWLALLLVPRLLDLEATGSFDTSICQASINAPAIGLHCVFSLAEVTFPRMIRGMISRGWK